MATSRERQDPWKSDLTYIIGHQRPDVDAIASAVGYAWHLHQMGQENVVAARAGQVGSQAAFALGHFGLKPPRPLSSAAPTFAHIAQPQAPVAPYDPLAEAMARLAQGERLVPVVDGVGHLLGGLTPLGLARAYAQVASGQARTSAQTCRTYVEQLPVLPASDRVRDRRGALLRGGGEEFLVVSEDGRYLGTTDRQRLLEPPRARLILVDHNELAQAVPGADEAEIVGVLDHHRLGNAPTVAPIPFVVEPVGSTSTLVAEACRRQGVTPPGEIAGLLLSGILSDTLVFRSPTVTERDRRAAEWLAELSGVVIPEYGQQLIKASPGLADRSADEIVEVDRKNYEMGGRAVSVAQVEVTGFQELPERRADLLEALDARRVRENLALICLMVTDVITIQSRLLCQGEPALLAGLPFNRVDPHEFDLGNIVSRKKQLIPALQGALEEIE
ncbi:MAG: DHH family phosphoesterase [Armatimonadetes bacterium]|nr:DHH family phosphoesterase [Armatimonadota bacterium]